MSVRWTKDSPPNLLLAIDPGAKWRGKRPYAGAALFQWGQVVWAELVKVPQETAITAGPHVLVRQVCEQANIARFVGEAGKRGAPGETLTVLAVEKPIIYSKGPARPQDILDLREIYGAFIGGIEAEVYAGPTPSAWKGSIDGDILNERVTRVLSATEKSILVSAEASGRGGLTSHVLDAVGIGLFVLGRAGAAMEI